MDNQFQATQERIKQTIDNWAPLLVKLDERVIVERKNSQNRNIKQILGHMVDSATNNTHRVIHFQYGANPMIFPDYAHHGNNDRWIAIQNFNDENWDNLIQLWRYSNYHFIHILNFVNSERLNNIWIDAEGITVTLRDMITSYPLHLELHMNQIKELIEESQIL